MQPYAVLGVSNEPSRLWPARLALERNNTLEQVVLTWKQAFEGFVPGLMLGN